MSDVKVVSGGQNQDPVALVTGRVADPIRLIGAVPTTQHAPLAAGSQHLVLPEWSSRNGPMVFQLSGTGNGSNLTGMGVAADLAEFGLFGAFVVLLNIAGIAITTTSDDSGSPAGSRFTVAATIDPGIALMFVCGLKNGVKMWFPVGHVAGC